MGVEVVESSSDPVILEIEVGVGKIPLDIFRSFHLVTKVVASGRKAEIPSDCTIVAADGKISCPRKLKGSLDPNSKPSIFFCGSRGGIKIYDMDNRRVDLSIDSDVELVGDLIRRRGGRRYNT